MGFSTSLQGCAVHEALLLRQDAEIRLLETMRRCLNNKIKCDREYAVALGTVATQGIKSVDRSNDELSGSLISTAWRTIMEEMDNAGKLIKQNADAIETRALDKLNVIYNEKRKAKKQHQEDYNRILQQFTHLSEDVSRKKYEYQKYLELYKLMRSRFEEHYVKGGRGGRKLDEVRDKYQKACRKLHLTHNEYVLLLCEAVEYEKNYRMVLMPGLLERQRVVQEGLVSAWKQLLQDVTRWCDMSSERFVDVQRRIEHSVNAVRPMDEYGDLLGKAKPLALPSNATFTFDDTLVEDTSGRLLANKLTVDNLTVDWLRTKLSELELAVRTVQEKQQHQNVAADGPSVANGMGVSMINASTDDTRELEELRCQERNVTRQLELIRTALNELGCEEVPPGCDLAIEQQQQNQQQQQQIKEQATDEAGSADQLVDEEWFHGVLPREEVVRLLTDQGDFLVRETTRNDECQTVLSVCWGTHKHFIVQTTVDGQYRFEGPAFPTIRELIVHQYKSGLPVTGRSGAVLVRPIVRERWELNNDDVVLLEKLGRGNFGDVYKARLVGGGEVAVKTCRGTLPDEHKRKFLQEGRILKQYDHPNIVKLIGICVQKQPIMIVMELVSGGSLLAYLRATKTSKELLLRTRISMCRDAAAGMRYLESKNCIHRDLAARNCLVATTPPQSTVTVKISDFGMSREEEEYIVSDGLKQIPIKWTAPEALNFGKYTSLCDVWSYGVLVWEIFSGGSTPYPGMNNSQAREKIDSGYRMPAPDDIPPAMYQLMLSCWQYRPEDRPHFQQVLAAVDALMVAT